MAGRKPPDRRKFRPPPRLNAGAATTKLVLLYGLHTVRAALESPRRTAIRLLGTREALAELGDSRGLGPEVVARDALDRLLPPGAVHQGVILEAEPLPEPDLDEVMALAPAQAVILVLDRANDPHNVGAVLRSAAAFGAAAVVLPRDHAPAITGALAKAASGALEIVPLVVVTNLARALDALKDQRFWCVGLTEDAEQPLAAIDLKGRVALVVGAEGGGLRRLTREGCDFLARLPTGGPVSALNMSNAAAIALYECARQRA